MMMLRKRKNKLYLCILILTICYSLLKITAYAETKQFENNTQVLLVVDQSGSLAEEEKSIEEALNLLYVWFEEEELCESADAIAFSNNAIQVELAEIDNVIMDKGTTNILVGLNAANAWVEAQLKMGGKVCVIVISDLIEDQEEDYNLETAQMIQDKIDEIIGKWKEHKKNDKMDYLFVTWMDNDVKPLVEFEEEQAEIIDEFRCSIFDINCVHWLREQSDAEEGEVISQIEMSGQMLKKILQVLTENSDIKVKNKSYLKNNESLNIETFYEAYILLGINDCLINAETGEKCLPICSTDFFSMYHLGMDENDKQFVVEMSDDTQRNVCESFCFYIPISNLDISYDTVYKKAGESFNIFGSPTNEYQKRRIIEPLKLIIYEESGSGKEVVSIKEMYQNGNGQYESSICLEKSGVYFYEIQMGNGQVLNENVINIISAEQTATDINSLEQPDEIVKGEEAVKESNLKIIIGVGGMLVVLFAGIAIYFKR